MKIDSATTLITVLRKAHLLEQAQVDELTRTPDSLQVPPEMLAEALVQLGWITPYQSKELLNGSGQYLTIGPYRVLDRLGQAKTGAIYKARNQATKAIVTLRV